MKAVLAVLMGVTLLLSMPGHAAEANAVHELKFDLAASGDIETFVFETDCDNSEFVLDPQRNQFTFRETAPSGLPVSAGTGIGCGEARWRIDVPRHTHELRVSFDGDRTLETVDGSLNARPTNFIQEVRVQDVNGATLAIFPYFAPGAVPSELRQFPGFSYIVPEGVESLDLVWHFEDRGSTNRPELAGTDLGEQYGATVAAPHVILGGVPVLDYNAAGKQRRSGTLLVDEIQVAVAIPADYVSRYDVVVQASVAESYDYFMASNPLGTSLGDAVSGGRWDAVNSSAIMVAEDSGRTTVFIPPVLVASGGPGTYEIVFRGVTDLRTVPALVPVVASLVLLPFPFAVAAFWGVRVFEREAFGAFQRSAKRLRIGVILTILYYLVVLVAAVIGQRLLLMTVWPMRFEALFLYVQIAVAVAAFWTFWLVAREMARMTKPAN